MARCCTGAGRGALTTGDIAMVAMDRRFVSFMHSYPNYIPLTVKGLAKSCRAAPFDRIYGGWWRRNIASGAKAAFEALVKRYLAAIA